MNKSARLLSMKPLALLITLITHGMMVFRGYMYKFIFNKVGKQCRFGKHIAFVVPQKINIGNRVRISNNVTLFGHGSISINDDVYIAHNVNIISFDHDYRDTSKSIIDAGNIAKPITIGSNVWIGTNATILKGVTIQNGVVIGANSVVTKNVPANTIVAGIPAIKIKERFQE